MVMRCTFCVMMFMISTSTAMALEKVLPQQLQQALDAAYASQNTFVIDAVKAKAAAEHPSLIARVEAYGKEWVANKKKLRKAEKKAKAKAEKEKSPWSGNVELAANYSSGNTETQDYKAASSITYKAEIWENTIDFNAYSSKEEGVQNDEEYRVKNQTRYNLSEKDYAFGEIEYVNDRFSGFDMRLTENLGYGYKFYDTDDFKLNGEASLGARQTEDSDGNKENSFLQKLAGQLSWDIHDGVTFTENVALSFAKDTNIFESESALKTQIMEKTYLKLAFNVEYISDVPDDKENTDTQTSLGVVYEF